MAGAAPVISRNLMKSACLTLFTGSATSSASEAFFATLLHELIHSAAIRIMPHLLDMAQLAV
jgi:hypothetical protein